MKNSRTIILLLLANSISGVAQGIAMLAVPWYFTGIIHREELFGKAYFVVTAVSLLWGLYAGTLIDRFDRRKIFLAINATGFVVISIITALGFAGHSLHWVAVASVFALTAFIYNIHYPNLYAYAQQITSKEDYARVTSLLEIQGQITFTVAGGLAALLLKGFDSDMNLFGLRFSVPFTFRAWQIHEIFAIGVVAYLITFLLVSRMDLQRGEVPERDTGSLRQRMVTGMKFLQENPLIFLFGNMSLMLFLTILVFGTYVATFYVDSFLGQEADVYAMGDMTFSFGALIAGFLTVKVFGEKDTVKGIIILTALAGFSYFMMISTRVVGVFFVANFVVGACNAAVRIQRVTFLFHHVPNGIIGRTGSIFFVVNVFFRLCLIALFSFPFFHEAGNVVYAVCILAVICLLAALALLLRYKALTATPEVKV